ncbi:TMEM175 family protein [Caballeronia grimmiae]|uniref:TMEM175 family protein n=1 Tax=Caballeronia grimmiae TaxID=1071679 RepID=UPI0038B9C01D
MLRDRCEPTGAETHGTGRGLDRFEGFSEAVFAIALTLLIVGIKVSGSPKGALGYSNLVSAMAEQWREYLTLVLCYIVIGAYWLQHHIRVAFISKVITCSEWSYSCSCWRSSLFLIQSASGASPSARVSSRSCH